MRSMTSRVRKHPIVTLLLVILTLYVLFTVVALLATGSASSG